MSQNDVVLALKKKIVIKKKLRKLLLKKKFISFSHFLSRRTLSRFLILYHSLTVPWCKALLPLLASTYNLLATVGLHLSISLSSSLTPPKFETQSLITPLHQNLKVKKIISHPLPHNLKPKLHIQNPMIISFTI